MSAADQYAVTQSGDTVLFAALRAWVAVMNACPCATGFNIGKDTPDTALLTSAYLALNDVVRVRCATHVGRRLVSSNVTVQRVGRRRGAGALAL